MRYATVCSGIECASAAWKPLGWEPIFFSEIEPFPSAVLAHHYPDVPNHGDMTRFKEWPDADIDLLAGGTPCQSFSAAGLRRGLADPRGNLMLTYLAIAARYRPRWLVWENVPGVLSSNGGRDFGAFLRGLGECGYGFAYRVLDAQFTRARDFPHAVPQRRRRVFVVGYLGDWRRAAAVLFDRESLSGNPAPRREAGEVAPSFTPSSIGGCREGVGTLRANGGDCHGGSKTLLVPPVSLCLNAGAMSRQDSETKTLIPTHGGVIHAIKVAAIGRKPEAGPQFGEILAFDTTQVTSPSNYSNPKPGDPCHPLAAGAHPPAVAAGMAVRRLTPTECERLMGIPDGYTRIPYRNKPAEQCPDGPRYKALGNGWAVNCAQWIGERIALVEAMTAKERAA